MDASLEGDLAAQCPISPVTQVMPDAGAGRQKQLKVSQRRLPISVQSLAFDGNWQLAGPTRAVPRFRPRMEREMGPLVHGACHSKPNCKLSVHQMAT